LLAFIQNTPEQHEAAGVSMFQSEYLVLVLTTQAQALNQVTITLDVLFLDIVKQGAALIDQLQQASAGVVVLLVIREVSLQVLNTRRQQRDLYFGRSRIAFGQLVFLNNLLLLFCRQ
jgi:hypothetical protein